MTVQPLTKLCGYCSKPFETTSDRVLYCPRSNCQKLAVQKRYKRRKAIWDYDVKGHLEDAPPELVGPGQSQDVKESLLVSRGKEAVYDASHTGTGITLRDRGYLSSDDISESYSLAVDRCTCGSYLVEGQCVSCDTTY